MKHNNKGFSLVELIIAITISLIVLGAATMMLGSAQKSYRVAEETINLQKESQILMERLASFIMECNKVDSAMGDTVLILKTVPRNQGKTVGTDVPAVVSIPNPKTVVIWQKDNKLYLKEDSSASFTVNASFLDSWATEENCISEYMDSFTYYYDSTKKQQVKITLLMKDGSQSYTLTDDIMIRNEII
ncbi:MAG: prepilin-type N-terminal cleavage/methylation domain-containing protein [Acetatifactor sp.]|nr:prepilin-type N-terminal cleavage/methylation domain-containing protein [Acetatifactor sp.]